MAILIPSYEQHDDREKDL